ncbi:MAG: hydroxymethylglutaryl-CoA synthase family protein [Sphingomonadales bacterium]
MTDTGILAAAAYVPATRLARAVIADAHAWANPGLKAHAKGCRAAANWDEDAITMAIAAGRRCLSMATTQTVARLSFATTTAPFLDRANAAIIAQALHLGDEVQTAEATGSLRAATGALRDGLALGGPGGQLLLAADKRMAKPASLQELRFGDAAAALLLGAGDVIARPLGAASLNVDLVDHYRSAETHGDYMLEERWLRDAGLARILPRVMALALADAGLNAQAIDRLIVPFSPAMVKKPLAEMDFDAALLADPLFAQVGDSGAAHPLLMLVEALATAKAGERILMIGFGQGADALIWQVTDAIDARRPVAVSADTGRRDDRYLKFLSHRGEIALDWGIRAERDNRTALTVFHRKSDAVTGFVGGVCRLCGTPQFPKARACVACGAIDAQDDYDFSGRAANLKTFTEDWQAHSPSPPYVYGNVGFQGGGNVFMELTDCDQAPLAIGMPLAMTFRIKDHDPRRGFRRYFWKAAPLREGQG